MYSSFGTSVVVDKEPVSCVLMGGAGSSSGCMFIAVSITNFGLYSCFLYRSGFGKCELFSLTFSVQEVLCVGVSSASLRSYALLLAHLSISGLKQVAGMVPV